MLLLSLPALASDAGTFRADLQHTGVYGSPALTHNGRVKWKFHTKGEVVSSPALAGSLVYIGSTDGNLYAVDRDSGEQKWSFKTKGRVTSSPAVSNGTLYFESMDSVFYALDAATGHMRWKFQTAGERRFTATHIHGSEPAAEAMPDPFDYYLSSPAVAGGAVYFGSGDGNIYALDVSTGGLKWKFHTGDVVHASPALADGVLYIGSWDSYFYALDAATGKEKWRFKTGEDPDIHNQVGIQGSAAVVDGTVYFGCRDSDLYALDATTGAKKWVFNNKGSWVIGSPAVKDGRVYFATSDSALFYALDANTGAPVFSLQFTWPMFSSPAIAADNLYLGSHEGKLFAIDLAAQKLTWTFQSDGSKQNGPTYTQPDGKPNYRAAFASPFYDDMIIGVRKIDSVGTMFSSPVIADGVLYIGSNDGNLYALE